VKLNPGLPRHKQHSESTKNGVLFTRGLEVFLLVATWTAICHMYTACLSP